MLLITLSITGIAWLSQSLKFIDFIVNKGLDVGTFIYLSSLILPSLFWVIIPISLFITTTYVYSKLVADSELIVLKASGIDRGGLIKPAMIFAGSFTLISFIISFYLLPASYREFKDMQYFIRDNYASLLLQEGVFSSPTKNLTVYIRERDKDGMFHGMLVHDTRDEKRPTTMMAQEGYLTKSSTGPAFVLINGNHQEVNKDTGTISILYFDRYDLQVNLFNKDIAVDRPREAQERYMTELFFPKDNLDEITENKLLAEGHNRITWPLYNMILALIALIPFISGEYDRRGQGSRIIFSSVLAVVTLIWSLFINSLVPKNPYFAIFSYATVFSVGGFLLYFLLERNQPIMVPVTNFFQKIFDRVFKPAS
jgi:lipopolysaccharide export system permease protein